MKKLWRVLMPFALALSFSVPVLADMDEAIAAMQRALDNLAQYGYHLGDGGRGSAWWVWNMNPGYYNQVDRTFYRGNTYALVGVGDSRVSDLDLKVYDENWNLIDSDEVVLKLISPLRPGLLEPSGADDFSYLVMPIRLNV